MTTGGCSVHGNKRHREEDEAFAAEPDATQPSTDEEVALPNIEICATIYTYCEIAVGMQVAADAFPQYDPIAHGRPVYVGQTIQDLRARDTQHLRDNTTLFDCNYTDRTRYKLVVLDQRRFPPATSPALFKSNTLQPAGEWMDIKERQRIAEFDTYTNGLNSTAGGQGRGWLIAAREAQGKASYKRWMEIYMPALRVFAEKNGHCNPPQTHPMLGQLVHRIRTGNTTVPPQFVDELSALGLDTRDQRIVQRDARWVDEYMPAFSVFIDKNGHCNPPQSHPVLGGLVNNIRMGNTTVPPQFEDELLALGFDSRNQITVQRDTRWADKYMPTFRVFAQNNDHCNPPRTHPVLGVLCSHIRTGNTTVPPHFADELFALGFDSRNQRIVQRDVRWTNKNMPAFREFYRQHGNNVSSAHPVLRRLVRDIRAGHTTIPPQFAEEFRSWGYV